MPPEPFLAAGLTSASSGSDTAVVICNGPSLASVPNKWLDKYPTFGANRVGLKYIPDVLVTLDLKMVHSKELQEEMYEWLAQANESFVSPIVEEYMEKEVGLPYDTSVIKAWHNILGDDGNLQPAFSNDPTKLLVSGGTVTYGLLQFALWKGFRKILMVGCNHTFRDSRGDHFDPRYNREVRIRYDIENTDPAVVASEPGKWFWSEENFVLKVNYFYAVAAQVFKDAGGEIINCTPDTKVPAQIFRVDDWRNY